MGEFPGSLDYFVNESRVFIDSLANPSNRYAIVIHKTASNGVSTAEDQGRFFQTNAEEKSVHYVVGKDGTVVQCVLEKDGAGGNCCLENGYDHFWDSAPTKANLNLCTYSIEHCDYSVDNHEDLTEAQRISSFRLVAYLAHKYHIGMDHIKGHNTIDPISRKNCPGNYPWNDLFNYLKGEGVMVPAGWNDNGTTLTAPNGVTMVLGFRSHVINNAWDAKDWPLAKEDYPTSVLESDISLGPGSRQVTKYHELIYTEKLGVEEAPIGQELMYIKADRDNCRTIIGQLQTQITQLKKGVPSADISGAMASLQKVMDDLKAFQG